MSTSGTGLAFSQSACTAGSVVDGDGAAGPIGSGEKLGFEALVDAEGGARHRHANTFGERGSLRIKDRRGAKLVADAVERRNRMKRRADIVAQDRRQQICSGADDGDVSRARRSAAACRRFSAERCSLRQPCARSADVPAMHRQSRGFCPADWSLAGRTCPA